MLRDLEIPLDVCFIGLVLDFSDFSGDQFDMEKDVSLPSWANLNKIDSLSKEYSLY